MFNTTEQSLPQAPGGAFTLGSLYPEELIQTVSKAKDKLMEEYVGSLKEQLLDSEVGLRY